MESDKDSASGKEGNVSSVEETAPSQQGNESKGSGKSCKQKKDKSKKRNETNMMQILKALSSLDSTEEKLAALCKKYADNLDESNRLELLLKQSERKAGQLLKEKDQLQTEHSKAILTRSRLEGLCRELQRQNKIVKDESLLRVREEEEKRREMSARLQSTLGEITGLVQENSRKNSKLQEENQEMAAKLKQLVDQYEVREEHVKKLVKHKELEAQLAEAKLAKAMIELADEKEKSLAEKKQLIQDITLLQARITELETTELGLRGQLTMYTEKYDEFQKALEKSNGIFKGFKEEMEKMSKRIKSLEKETKTWKQRYEKSNVALLDMATDKQKRDAELLQCQRKINQLESLCRALQAERNGLLQKDKESTPKPNEEEGEISDCHAVPQADQSSQNAQETICSSDAEQTET